MTQITLKPLIIQVVFSLALGFPLVANAGGNLGEAEAALANAHNKYFDALMAGKGDTVEQDRKLRTEMVTPVASYVNRVIQSRNDEFMQQIGLDVLSPERFDRDLAASKKADANWADKDKPVNGIVDFARIGLGSPFRKDPGVQGGGSGSDFVDASKTGAGSSNFSNTNRAPAVSPPRQNIGLDGSNVPKVLEFPGPKKKKEIDLNLEP